MQLGPTKIVNQRDEADLDVPKLRKHVWNVGYDPGVEFWIPVPLLCCFITYILFNVLLYPPNAVPPHALDVLTLTPLSRNRVECYFSHVPSAILDSSRKKPRQMTQLPVRAPRPRS